MNQNIKIIDGKLYKTVEIKQQPTLSHQIEGRYYRLHSVLREDESVMDVHIERLDREEYSDNDDWIEGLYMYLTGQIEQFEDEEYVNRLTQEEREDLVGIIHKAKTLGWWYDE